MIDPSDRLTDGRVMAYACYSIYAVARNKKLWPMHVALTHGLYIVVCIDMSRVCKNA